MSKIRLVNNTGRGLDTKLIDVETGDDLTKRLNIYDIQLSINVSGLIEGVVKMSFDELQIDVAKFGLAFINEADHEEKEAIDD